MNPALSIDSDRLLGNLRELATIGKKQTGVYRPAYSAHDLAAREWLLRKFQEAGLDARIDRVGNVVGRCAGVRKALLIGSHTDSVPTGGWLDGSLGVIYGLEIARALSADRQSVGIDVVSFADEEGTFAGWFGSRTYCGEMDETNWPDLRNAAGTRLPEALEAYRNHDPARLDTGRTVAYLEAHIEQGPKLESLHKRIGIVTSIVGIRTRCLHFLGRADHAGTTPMNMRNDASRKLVRLANRLWERFEAAAEPDTVWNFGNVNLLPGAANVVAAAGELFVQYRDSSSELLRRFDAVLAEEVARTAGKDPDGCRVSTTMATEPIHLDARLQQTLREAARRCHFDCVDIPSGAGHDAAVLAKYVPTAMLFVPSRGGRSHTFDEDTGDEDIVAGAQVMFEAAKRLLKSDA